MPFLDRFIRKILSVFPKFIQDFYDRHESVLLYLFAGGLTTVVSIIAQFVPAHFGLPTKVNTTISWICAVTFAFFANKVWVFKNKSETKTDWIKQASEFYGARLLTYFLELGFMILTVDALHFSEYIMKLIAQVFILVINYLFSKFVIFAKKKKEKRSDV